MDRAEKMAGELLKLYAERKVAEGFTFGSADAYFRDFEAGFGYEETPDQLKAIDQPPFEWASTLDVFQHVLEHEQKVTSLIHNLYALAVKENDYASQLMLQWFINEQIEEEKNASTIVEQAKMIEAKGSAILYLDHELGERGE